MVAASVVYNGVRLTSLATEQEIEMASATIRLTEDEHRLIKGFAAQQRRSMADVIRLAILDQIEDEYDLAVLKEAEAEYEQNPESYTLDEIKERHNIS